MTEPALRLPAADALQAPQGRTERLTGRVGALLDRAALPAALLLFAFLCANRLLRDGISVDEAFAMDTAGRPIAEVIRQAIRFELQPPVYYLLLHGWLQAGDSLVWARLLSVLSMGGAVVLADGIRRRMGSGLALALLPVLFALSPRIVWFAVTAREYALAMLLTLASTALFLDVWVLERDRPRWRAGLYAACSLLAMFTFYYTGFVIAAHGVIALLRRRRLPVLFGTIGGMALVLALWAPVVLEQASRHGADSTPLDAPQPVGDFAGMVRALGRIWFVTMITRTPFFERPWVLPLLCAGLAGVVVLRLVWPASRWSWLEGSTLALAVVPFAILVVLRYVDPGLVTDRYFTFTVFGQLALLAVLIDRIRPRVMRGLAGAACLAAGLVTIASVQLNFSRDAWSSVARDLHVRRAPGEPVVFFTAEGELAFRFHSADTTALYALPARMTMERWSLAELALRDEASVRARMEEVVLPGGSFWLVEYAARQRGLNYEYLESFLRERAEVIERRPYPQLSATRYRLRPEAGGGRLGD